MTLPLILIWVGVLMFVYLAFPSGQNTQPRDRHFWR